MMNEKTNVNKDDQVNRESNESDDVNVTKQRSTTTGTDEGQSANAATTGGEVADEQQCEKQAMESVAELSAAQAKTDPSHATDRKIRRYSSGVSFKRRCTVKQIPCDQLNALACGKKRISRDDEHRNWVLRRIFTLGGWVRTINVGQETITVTSGGETYTYVLPNTPIPNSIQPTNQDGKRRRRKNKKNIFSNVKFWKRSGNGEHSSSTKSATSC